MFGRKKTPPIRSLIGETSLIDGNLMFSDGLRIDGTVNGDVIAADGAHNILVISDKARVTGRVCAGHVIINGVVNGPVQSTELLELQPKACIVGDVSYQELEMHQGARVEGELRPLARVEPQPTLKLAVSQAG